MRSPVPHFSRNAPLFFQQLAAQPRPVLWVGALSFEERCVASLSLFREHNFRIDGAALLEYDTQVISYDNEINRRKANLDLIYECARQVTNIPLQRIPVSPYSFNAAEEEMTRLLEFSSGGTIVVDITCMTKIHTIATAATLTSGKVKSKSFASYTSPENYGDLQHSHEIYGWRDIIVAPIDDIASLANEATSRGIIIPGHEGDRLEMALGEIEPSGGTIIMADAIKHPEMRLLCEKKNIRVRRRLKRLGRNDWQERIIPMENSDEFFECVEEEVERARSEAAPVIIFPFGPKPMIFLASLCLGVCYRQASWFVYPVPAAYDVNYSEGIGSTRWMLL